MVIGLIGPFVVTGALLVAALPSRAWRALRTPRRVGLAAWLLTMVVNESPFLALYWLLLAAGLAAIEGDLSGGAPTAWAWLALLAVAAAASAVLLRRSLTARSALGAGRLPWVRIVLGPLPLFPLDLLKRSNLPYGPAGRENLLDVYIRRARRGGRPASGAPILIHFHGGGFSSGRKSFEGRPLLHGLARRGWVCISANYRLHPHARTQELLHDAERVIAWAREHAGGLGADPDKIVVAGSSAGAHLAVTSALRRSEGVVAGVGLYGWYGQVDVRASPLPILIVHGEHDTYVAVDHAREFVRSARAAGADRLDYAELRGGQHSFDLLHSVRFESVVSAVAAFAERAFSQRDVTERRTLPGTPTAPSPPEAPGPRGHW